MKKGLFAEKTVAVLAGLILLSFSFFGCKSTPVKEGLQEVNPLALLETDSSIYVRVPVSSHVELVTGILTSVMPSIKESDAKLLANHIDELYAGLGTVQDRSRLQVSALGDFPSIAVRSVCTEKNGWKKSTYEAVSDENALSLEYPNLFTVYSRTDSDFKLSFCSGEVVACAQKINPLLEEYAKRSSVPQTDYARWISKDDDDLYFYITRPGQYLRNLIGQTVTIGCENIYGSLTYEPSSKSSEYSGNYRLSFYITLSQPRTMRAMLSMLELSMLMLDGEVEQIDSSTIRVYNLLVTEKEISDLFTRDPVTGKHFKVVGDSIITE